jgi:DNA-binding MarR family transcriptional regulator
LLTQLSKFSATHPYTRRFERFLSSRYRKASKGKKHRARTLALKVVHILDGSAELRRADVVQKTLADPSKYTQAEVDTMILRLHQAGLIQSQQGPHAKVRIV